MSSLNVVIMMGNMTRDPAVSYLPSQTPVCDFGLATTRKFKKADGTKGEETCFVDCQIFGKRAEVIGEYFKKGSPIFIQGRLRFESWVDKEGLKKTKLRILVENFEFCGGKKADKKADEAEAADNPGGDEIPF
jgi:single-strand DNA-binding protein